MRLNVNPAPHIRAEQSTRTLMRNVLIALTPCAACAAGYFGVRALALMLASVASAVLSEALWQRLTGHKLLVADGSAAVTGLILALNLPPRAPWWLAAVGSAFAAVIVKGLFGGLGGNLVNPTLAARALLLASWPRHMTAWTAPTGLNGVADAVATATPLVAPARYTPAQLFLGDIPGCLGEVCKLAILIGLLWLLATRTVSWHIPAAMLASAALFGGLLGGDPLRAVLSGGLLFGAVFVATDCVTSPIHPAAQLLYGAGAGLLVAVIRRYSAYPEGVTFAILLMNAATPLLDGCFRRRVYGHGWEARSDG